MASCNESSFSFDLYVSTTTHAGQPLSKKRLKGLSSWLSLKLEALNKYIQNEKGIKCMFVSKVSNKEGQMMITFMLRTIEELEEFNKLSEAGVLSKTLTEFSERHDMDSHSAQKQGTSIQFRFRLDKATYDYAKGALRSKLEPQKKCRDEAKKTDYSNRLCKDETKERDSLYQLEVKSPLQHYKGLSAINITVQPEGNVVKKEIIIVEPVLESGKNLTSMWLMLHTKNMPNNVDVIKMIHTSSLSRLWIAKFCLPLAQPLDNLNCWFSAEIHSTFWIRKSTDEVVKGAWPCGISNNIVQRWYFGKQIYIDDLIEHYKDIVMNCSARMPIRECIMQIEAMWVQISLKREQARKVLNTVLKSMNEKAENQQLLLFVICGIFFKNISEVGQDILTYQARKNIISALRCFRASDLTNSCAGFMMDLAIDFCKSVYGDKYDFLTFVHVTYPFFDEKQLLQKVIEICRRKEIIVHDETDQRTGSDILNLFKELFENSSDPDAKAFFNTLLRHIPTKLAVRVYISVSSSIHKDSAKQSEVYSALIECVVGSIKSFFKSAKHTCVQFCDLWQCFKNLPELNERTFLDFETALLQRTVNVDRQEMEALKQIVYHEAIFQSLPRQIELVESLTKVKNVALHFDVFEIASAGKFEEACRNLNQKCFSECFDAAFLNLKSGCNLALKVKDVYLYICKALEVPIIKQQRKLQESLDIAALDFIKQCDLRELLSKAKDMEKITNMNPHIGELFRHHVKRHLQQKSINNFCELLASLCGTSTNICVSSRVIADMVCTILDLCVPSIGSDLHKLLEIVRHYDVWKAVFEARGPYLQEVQQATSYKAATNCIKTVAQLIQSSKITYGYFQELTNTKSKENVIAILVTHCSLGAKELSHQWDSVESYFCLVLENTANSISVLTILQDEMPLKNMPADIKQLVDYLKLLSEDIQQGKITKTQIQERVHKDLDTSELISMCQFLLHYVKSKIFWTACKGMVEGAFNTRRAKIKEDLKCDAVERSISSLFEESKSDEDERDIGTSETLLLLEVLTEVGIKEYKAAWTTLIKEQEKDVSFALQLLQDANIGEEILCAEKILLEPISNDLKDTLHQLGDIHSYEYKVDAVKLSLAVFDAKLDENDELFNAILAFDKIRENTEENCPFSLVVSALKLVDKMSRELVKETVDILYALSESSSLVDFLRQIVDDDIRNLIDAVEDRSEQYVQESTVSALIEVKSFLQSALVKSLTGIQASEFLSSINKQVLSLSCKASKLIPGKIHECMSSLHNLKSLYGNVANRGEMTAEVIANVLQKGKLKFMLNRDGECDFYASYKHVSRKEKQHKSNLVDLRSRALLLMNTQIKAQDSRISNDYLEKFILYMDLSIEIAELCKELHQSGNIEFSSYTTKTDCQGLCPLREKLLEKKQNWDRALKMLRSEFYLLNFIHGPEIHLLYNFFEKEIGKEKVNTILRYIHPEMSVEPLLEEYKCLKATESTWSNAVMLKCCGKVLHFGYRDKTPVQRQFHLKVTSKRVTDVVQNKTLFVAALDENSNQVVKTLLALYHNTTRTLPEPHQVLICTRDTTWNELELLLSRCFGSYAFTKTRQLFCISNIEILTNELQFRLVEALKNTKTEDYYLLSMICRGSSKHPFLDEFGNFISKSLTPVSDEILRQAFQHECPNVVTYTSESPGLGKSNAIKTKAIRSKKSLTKVHISGQINKNDIIGRLSAAKIGKNHALHIDVANVDNPNELDTFIFELIILGYVTAGFQAFGLETKFIYIEIANTINETLRNSLNTIMSFKREVLKWKDYSDFIVSAEINSPVQVVCHYLNCLENGSIDRKDLFFSGDKCESPLDPPICRKLLKKYLSNNIDTSFSVVNTFLNVLADQLKKMSCSSYFRVSRVSEMVDKKTIPSIRSTLLEALVEASHEFASRSIKSCRSAQFSTIGRNEENIQEHRIQPPKQQHFADQSSGMVRWEDSNHLIYVFHNQNIQTLSPLYRIVDDVPPHIKSLFESQMKRRLQNFKQMDQSSLQKMLQQVARTNPQPLHADIVKQLNAEYALTPDNLLKMVLIMLRVKARIPVIVMGETGCGKTSLIRYLAAVSEVDFDVLSIHAGIDFKEITDKILQQNEAAQSLPSRERWLLLDEINTSEHIGVMNDAMCSGTCLDKILAPNLIIMGACNPYRLRSESAITTAGLKSKVQTDELSKLVYRVLPVPERMIDYVWDFGSLSDGDEAIYIRRMIEDVCFKHTDTLDLLQDLLSESQKFVREAQEASYCVSLRDIQRCKTLLKWFMEILPRKGALHGHGYSTESKSIILSLAVCYHSRFSSNKLREKYRKKICGVFARHSKYFKYDENELLRVIIEEQKDILDRMELPTGTAKNTALRENVFVILVCLLNRIPIFLVGKPGCSKSLSMQVIRSNLRGKDSKDDFFKSLPQLYCVSFQGSESSTSDGIVKVFEKAIRYQESNIEDEVLSVVILDEIGLAEISKFNPLKVLHSLLEPDGRPQPDVAVVGISNWSLDASKMNRGIHLSRPDMDEEELYQTGVSISESFLETKYKKKSRFSAPCIKLASEELYHVLRDIAQSYLKYVDVLRFKHFHGLRDFYSLVKFISKQLLTNDEMNVSLIGEGKENLVLEGLQRNFGGLPTESATLLKMFQVQAQSVSLSATNVLNLIKDNIEDKTARHLMCITNGESDLSLIEKVLTESHREERVIIFGSHFEEDQTADYNYRILSRIILCMEQGFVLILRDLDNVYGSLYDMLNQNYTMIGKKKHCRVALGHYSNPICQVHDDFRCIVLVDESDVDFTDPPFLNRFEKQYLNFTHIISSAERSIISELEIWMAQFCSTENCYFETNDCFPIYSPDMIPSLVIKLCRDASFRDGIESDTVLEMSKNVLVNIAQPDAIFRVTKNTNPAIREKAEQIKEKYLNQPIHSGIWHFIDTQTSQAGKKGLMTIVLTNSSIHVRCSQRNEKYQVQVEQLGAFKSEKQLSLRIHYFWNESSANILFFHCSMAEDRKHIQLAKTTIENARQDALRESPELVKHVYMILHLDRRRTETKSTIPINFLSGWEIVTMDAIEDPKIPLSELSRMSLSDTVSRKRPLNKFLTEQLFWCFTRIKYQKHGRNVDSILMIIEKIKRSERFLEVVEEVICDWVKSESSKMFGFNWQELVAIDTKALTENSSFMLALEQKISSVISIPLSKLLYQLENFNALATFFYEDRYMSERQTILESLIRNETVFNLSVLPVESGPECYLCTAADLTLKMPVSRLIFDRIEETKEDFMDSFLFVKGNLDLENDDDVPGEIMESLFDQHESLVKDNILDLGFYMYEGICDDYLHDFSNFISFATSSQIREEKRIELVKWTLTKKIQLLNDNPVELMVKLHAVYWIFPSVLNAELHLLDTCAKIINAEEDFLSYITRYGETETDLDMKNQLEGNEKFISPIETDQKSLETGIVRSVPNALLVEPAEDTETDNMCPNAETSDSEILYLRIAACSSDASLEPASQQVMRQTENIPLNEIKLVGGQSRKQLAQMEKFEKQTLTLPKGCLKPANNTQTSEENDGLDAGKMLVEYLSLKLLPTETCLNMFGTYVDWNLHVSIVLTLASLISSEPKAFHVLRFFQDLVSTLYIQQDYEKHHMIVKLGNTLYLSKASNLDSTESFECVYEMLFTQNQLEPNIASSVLASYLNRCQAANRDSQVMIHFLTLLEDKLLSDIEYGVFKPPVYMAFAFEIDDPNNTVFHKIICDSSIELKEWPFLFALDAWLKAQEGSSEKDSHLATLIIDIIETFFAEAEQDLERSNASLLCAHKIIDSNNYDLRFVTAIAFWKSFAKSFAGLLRQDCTDCLEYTSPLPVMQAILNSTENCQVSLSLKQYLFKEYGNGMLPWQLSKRLEANKQIFANFKMTEQSEDYNFLCIEGCPLYLHAPNSFKNVADIILGKGSCTQENLIKTFHKISGDKNYMLALHGVVQSHFYIARSYKQQDDTQNQLAKTISDAALAEKMDPVSHRFLSCLLGTQIFSEPVFELNEKSSAEDVILVVFCTSLFALILSSGQQIDNNNLSLLAKCLLKPLESKANILLSITENLETNTLLPEPVPVERFISCQCGNRLAYRQNTHVAGLQCPICGEKISEEPNNSYVYATNGENVGEQNQYNRTQAGSIALPRVTSNLISLLVNVCLLGSLALNISKLKDLEPIADISEVDNIPATLFERIKSSFRALTKLLHLGYRETFIFLQACLLKFRSFICENNGSYNTPEEILLWSRALEDQYKVLIPDRHGTIINLVKEQKKVAELGDVAHLYVNETDKIDLDSVRRECLPSLFRIQGQPDRSSLELNVDMLATGSDHPYPFLAFVLKYLPQLEITKHLLPLIQWHLATVTHTGYRLRRHECLEMSVKEFLGRDKKGGPIRKLLEKRFQNLQEAWACLMKSSTLLNTNISRLTYSSKMKDCLLLDRKSPLYCIIKDLVDIQNNFLDNTLIISVRSNCQALKCLSRTCEISAIPCGIVADLKASAVVSYHWDDKLLEYAHADLRYGYGKHIQYEFEAIEKILALDLVVNKVYLLLDTNLPSIVFMDEFYSTMVKEVIRLIPQTSLPADMARKLKEKGEETTGLTVELLGQIAILMTLAKKTRGDPEQPLVEYLEIWKNVLTSPFPVGFLPSPEGSVKLCHLVALYGLLEELNAEPISNLSDEYRKPLSDDMEEQLSDILKADRKKAEMILQATKRFTYRCIYAGGIDSSRSLVEFLEDKSFWPIEQIGVWVETNHAEERTSLPVNLIPDEIRVHHVYEMMSFLQDKLMELTEKDVRLLKITASFKTHSNVQQSDRRRKVVKQRRI